MEVDPERLGRTAQEWERIAGACRRSAAGWSGRTASPELVEFADRAVTALNSHSAAAGGAAERLRGYIDRVSDADSRGADGIRRCRPDPADRDRRRRG